MMAQSTEWDDLATLDPLWAIRSDPGKRNNGWQLEDFLATGEADVRDVMAWASRHGLPVGRQRALDFGCGVGRLSRALAAHFDTCTGVDASARMIDEARRLNSDRGNLRFAMADARQLPAGPFDLVLSLLVLQHLSSRGDIAGAIAALAATVGRGGALVMGLATHIPVRYRFQPRPRLYRSLRGLGVEAAVLYRRLGLVPIRMRAIPDADVRAILTAKGIEVVDTRRSIHSSGVRSTAYLAARR